MWMGSCHTMSTISISIDENNTIEAGPWKKFHDVGSDKFIIKIRNKIPGIDRYGIEDEICEADMLLDRQEMISLGYGLLSMCGVQV